MAYKVVWTESALADLELILEDMAQTSAEAASKLGNAILDHVEILPSFPRIGPRYLRDPSGRTREIACGKYRIFYRIDERDQRIQVLTIWHASREEPDFPGLAPSQ